MDFKDWFCLKDRESFTINPEINPSDAKFYFGRAPLQKRMYDQIKRSFLDPRVPKMMVYGPYGCGKTQTLYHLAYWLKNSKPSSCKGEPYAVHLAIEVQSKSTAANWHLQIMKAIRIETIQDWLGKLFAKSANFEQEVAKLTSDPNIARAFTHLRGGGNLAFDAWRWLEGYALTARELQGINVTQNLGDVGVGDFVAALQACGNLAGAVGNCLILFMDEMEELHNVREGDAAESWHLYIKKLADSANSSVGVVIGFRADTGDEAPKVLIRGDVRRRLAAINYVELQTLSAVANVKQFVEEMLAQLVDPARANDRIQQDGLASTVKTYPFTATAFDLMCDYACQDSVKSTPGNIIRTISECAMSAWDVQKKVIDDEIVNAVAPLMFE